MRLRLIDTDNSLPGQLPLAAALAEGWGMRVDVREMGPSLRLWARRSAMGALAAALERAGEPPGRGAAVVNFLGSGDFHHLAVLLIAAVDEPLTVVHFDNHPDWVRFAPHYHCGSWVNRVLEMAHVRRVITIGPCSDDLNWPQLKGANLAALTMGRLELYPWRHAPSFVWGAVDPGPSADRMGNRIVWRNVGEDFAGFIGELVKRLPDTAVWLTIDKDVLRPDDAVTNWDQGQMPLSALTAAVGAIGRRRRIIGVDICGEFSPPEHRQLAKRWEAWTDQPSRRSASAVELGRNTRANNALLATLQDVLA